MEYDSFIRHKVRCMYSHILQETNFGNGYLSQAPVLSIVGNDAGWTQIARGQVPILGRDTGCKLAVRLHFKI